LEQTARAHTHKFRLVRKEDIRLLKSTARKEPVAKIAKALKRTEGATRQKANSERISLSITRKKRPPAKKR
jgi:hypothetical protein